MGAVTGATVRVVGAGIAGAACAAALRSAGIDATVVERGRAVGGRLASPQLHGRRVDVGAAYFTVSDDAFAVVVDDWVVRGLAREWTHTFDVFDGGERRSSSGPVRYATPNGLRSLARDLHGEVTLQSEFTALDAEYDVTVLAVPDPQARRLAGTMIDWVEYDPALAVVAGFAERGWELDAAFVNDDPDLAFLADDGARRGDGAPVLVLHTTAGRARAHLDDPHAAAGPVLAAASRLLHLDTAPLWTHVHRWTFAKPSATHGDAPFWWDGRLAVCGDSWCPTGSPRVESAWLSGHRLGTTIGHALGSEA